MDESYFPKPRLVGEVMGMKVYVDERIPEDEIRFTDKDMRELGRIIGVINKPLG